MQSVPWWVAGVIASAAACSSQGEAAAPGPSGNAGDPSASVGGASGSTPSGGVSGSLPANPAGGAPAVQIGGTAGTPAGAAGAPASCASARAEAALLPVYLAFAFDVSGSMGKGDKPWHDRSLKWEPVVEAIRSFLEGPASTGLNASMTFFPAEGGEDARCDDESYVTPDVAMSTLPSAVFGTALDSIGSEDWRGGTPTLQVMRGIISYVERQRQASPGRYAAVLVTDGYPQDCEDDEIENLSEIVAGVARELPTYVVGVANPPLDDAPDTVSDLEQVAIAGGTGHAYLIDTGDPEKTVTGFRAAIDAIRGSAIACVVDIPAPPDGRKFDKESVIVRYQGSAAANSLAYDPSCVGGPAWHYDDPANPRQIVLCDQACGTIKADAAARLDVEFSCERLIHVPE